MFLKKFIYVNWGNIPALEFDFGPINLLSGGNGSGKTTAADAIQTIMTAAHDTLFTYNPGQDEATQRGRNKTVRTLASYVLGCDDGCYARPEGAIGYLAACFAPTKGESCDEFTALIGVSASLDSAGSKVVARQNDIQFFILPGQSLNLSDLVSSDQHGKKHVLALSECKKQLQRSLGDEQVQKYDSKRQYLRRLYAAVKGQDELVTEREALNAAKAFSRFMAYKPVKSINGFVANEILEPRDLGEAIRSVSDLMKTIYSMESEASALNQGVLALNQTQLKANQYIEKWTEQHVLSYLSEQNRFVQQQGYYLQAKEDLKRTREQIEKTQRDKQISQDRRDNTRDQLLSLEAKRQGIESLQEKDQCEQMIQQGGKQLSLLAKPLLEQHHAAINAIKASAQIYKILNKSALCFEIEGLKTKQVCEQAKAILSLQDKEAIDFNQLLGHDWVDISPLENHLEQALATESQLNSWYQFWYESSQLQQGYSLRDQVQFLLERKGNKLEQTRRQMKAKQSDIDALQTAQVNYPFYTRAALEAINKDCPQAEPRVLCDYVELGYHFFA